MRASRASSWSRSRARKQARRTRKPRACSLGVLPPDECGGESGTVKLVALSTREANVCREVAKSKREGKRAARIFSGTALRRMEPLGHVDVTVAASGNHWSASTVRLVADVVGGPHFEEPLGHVKLHHLSTLPSSLRIAQRSRAHFTPQHWLLCHMGLY